MSFLAEIIIMGTILAVMVLILIVLIEIFGVNGFIMLLILVYWIGLTIYVLYPRTNLKYLDHLKNRLLEIHGGISVFGFWFPFPVSFYWVVLGLTLIIQPDFEYYLIEINKFLGWS